MKIARALERFVPEPPLFPARTARRSRAPRRGRTPCSRTACASSRATAIGQDPEAMASVPRPRRCSGIPASADAHGRCRVLRPVVALADAHLRGDRARRAWRRCPAQLDRVDALLAEGVIGGERPNAADFQVAPSVRLMLCFDQLREHIDARPAGRHARALVPDYPGPVPGSVPRAMAPVLTTCAGDDRRLAVRARGRDRRASCWPRLLRRARPAPARLRRALRRRGAGRAAVRLPPLRCQRRRAAPAAGHRRRQLADWRTAIEHARGAAGIERVGLFGSSFGGGHAISSPRPSPASARSSRSAR